MENPNDVPVAPTTAPTMGSYDAIAAAENAAANAAQIAANSANATYDLVKNAIVTTAENQRKLADDKVKILNTDRVQDIIRSREPRTDSPISENLKRLSGETAATKGNIAVVLVALPPNTNAAEFMAHVKAFAPETVAIGADMFGMNNNSDQRAEHHTDETFKKVADNIYTLAGTQATEMRDLLHSRQPFSDVFQKANQSVINGQ